MAVSKIKVKNIHSDIEEEFIHFNDQNNYTLCGLDTDENPSKIVKHKVNCDQCIQIVNFCKKMVKSTDYIHSKLQST